MSLVVSIYGGPQASIAAIFRQSAGYVKSFWDLKSINYLWLRSSRLFLSVLFKFQKLGLKKLKSVSFLAVILVSLIKS